MKIIGTNRRSLRLVELKLVLTHDEVEQLTKVPLSGFSEFTQVVLRNYGLVNNRGKPTDLARDIASTLSFVSGAEHDFPLRLAPTVVSQPVAALHVQTNDEER